MPPNTQRAIVISGPGGPEMLKLQNRPVPEPQEGEVLIEIAAAGVNRHDCNQRKAGPGRGLNPVPGLEVAGIIVAVGDGVTSARLGEEVAALTDGGGYAEFVVAPSELALPKPPELGWLEAAALPEALFTTWHNFFDVLGLRPGERVLIHGGASGVGSLATQVLCLLGYDVFSTCGSAEKCEAAVSFGARAAFDYTEPHLGDRIKAASDGIDVILDMSAGAHLASDLEVLRFGGRIGHLTPGATEGLNVPLRALMAKQVSVTGSLLRPLPLTRKAVVAERLKLQLWPHLGSAIRPAIARALPLDEAAEAHRCMEMGDHAGKLMLYVK